MSNEYKNPNPTARDTHEAQTAISGADLGYPLGCGQSSSPQTEMDLRRVKATLRVEQEKIAQKLELVNVLLSVFEK